MQKVFRTIQGQLRSLSGPVQGNALKRINTLSGLICGIISKGSSHLVDLGSGIEQDIDANSKTQAAKRFLSNKWTDYDTHFLPFLRPFLKGIFRHLDPSQGLRLVIDGSQAGTKNAALMISVVWKKRGIPICWFVKSGGKGQFKEQDHLQVLEQAMEILKDLIPSHIPVTILGDGEFDGIELQKWCLSVGWNYVLRTACNSVFFEHTERFQARAIRPDPTHDVYFIPQLQFTNAQFEYVNFVCWHDKTKHEHPIYLISNLNCPRLIIDLYNQRYSIECLFKDLKSNAFNIHKTRLKKPHEVFNLILIAALAFLLLTDLAFLYDTPKWRKKVQRVRKDRKVLSFFSFAFKLIHYFNRYQCDFNFSSLFSKNSS